MSKFKNLTPEQKKAALEAAKVQFEEQQQKHDAIFKEAMQASSQIHQYNQDLGNCVDNASKDIKLAGKTSKCGCEII
ncbi:hypothetical protein RHHCN13_06025 [Rickettsia conorii subsp. heilongjiangensis]|uniref:Uncharacterized protein n=1 Tax=Rickettsia conorii subsp. heilongjiangensis TaxID=226665 RepID=A0AAD1LT37_RICCR|nr:hypothetical protein [Rickettsia conorii]AEK75158.1 hypothetical protein Rh054_06495 [Rickettsia conorii subsp. heilongjiangensis 054]BBM91892.1 hypothetical protein RHCH81_06025 [Rickettsia conorii subsp. heilongjiangensis]BBM93101.1 hypothetical protein RHHCN13_06025 [Rickettsia conorii subsp. heilongjiangensis]BBM94310.1 hypothetical protein RHSENDAI29_06025 [Rickettsia conorii subsp. heilongjiangensis]BBM95519.1 hypothetical protein RHSENDAI58_06025 [Rickettsia conorii subsp. heilongjia